MALSRYGLGLEDLRSAIVAENVNQAKGTFDGPHQAYTIAGNDQLLSSAAYRQVIVAYLALTAFFSVGVVRIAHSFQAQTSVADLIPAHNRVTDVFKRYQSFSKPATVEILLKVKQGTIYTPQTLARIWRITRELDLVPGIDHVTLTSIASEKVRVIRPTPPGLSSEPVMTNKIPATQASGDREPGADDSGETWSSSRRDMSRLARSRDEPYAFRPACARRAPSCAK